MSVQDAANLLIGVNASPGPKYSVSTVNDFRRLLLTRDLALPENIEDWDEIRGGDDWLSQAFRRGAQCGPAIEAMIRSYMPDEFGNVAHDSSVSASISFVRPSLLCKIAIYYGTLEDPEPIVVADFEPHLIDTEGIQPDRLDETIITGRTLASVGKALSS
ncbi:hypothetical protein J2X36_004406 [Methylobacterium sp. BE186]|uniref:hypothetical protein n=1 Tax=Methylobacterium sp. BE186 TaxID=2817715 RepID=UPI00285BD18A|nr:hypothetical protein [Methylobacterium sp. BE186]MDR7039630.1 hypothetical protein [Methylobacterium sp. BE186]